MASSVTIDNHVFQEHLFEKVASKVREMVQWFLNRVMQEEQMLFLGCMGYERTTVRRGYRNGYDNRRLDTQWGSIHLRVPKVRNTLQPFRTRVFDRYRRRQGRLDKLVEQWMAFGMSTRKAGHALHNAFDCLVSPETVSRIIAELDEEIAAFHTRPFEKGYRYLFLDAKHGCIKRSGRRSRRGRKGRAVLLLAWGIDHRGKEELVDFRVAPGEDEASWTAFLTDLEARGLRAENRWAEKLEMIISDDAGGIEAALGTVYPTVPRQLCIFHKLQNIATHLHDRKHRKAILADAAKIYRGLATVQQARGRLRRWARRWYDSEPEAVEQFVAAFESTLRHLAAGPEFMKRVGTNNPIERFIRELTRRFNTMGAFANARSWERATLLMWKHLKLAGYPHSSQSQFTRNS